jgi:prepilin-type N-terminal cleavage/methylation domain-containing protein
LRRGFTLLELLLVIAVLGVLTALALPNASPSFREQLLSAAQIMAEDLAYGRSLAVANNSRYRFTFDTLQNRYLLAHSGTDHALDTLPTLPFDSPADTATQHIVALDQLPQLGTGVTLLAVGAYTGNNCQSLASLEFVPLGGIDPPQDVVVWLSVGSGSAQRYLPLTINPVTGLAAVGSFSGYGPPASLLPHL